MRPIISVEIMLIYWIEQNNQVFTLLHFLNLSLDLVKLIVSVQD